MEKLAHLGSLATRLNNLEQKFDGSGDLSELIALVERLYQNTLFPGANANAVLNPTWSGNESIFDTTGCSLIYSV